MAPGRLLLPPGCLLQQAVHTVSIGYHFTFDDDWYRFFIQSLSFSGNRSIENKIKMGWLDKKHQRPGAPSDLPGASLP